MAEIDIALVLDTIRPGAQWRQAGTYQDLVDTWEDKIQTLPTWKEIEDAWPEVDRKWHSPTANEIVTMELDNSPILSALVEAIAERQGITKEHLIVIIETKLK